MNKGDQLNKLERVLSRFLSHAGPVHPLAQVLDHAYKIDRIFYSEIEEIINDDPKDVLLIGYEWRLLIPTRSVRGTLDWEDKMLLLNPSERG